MMIPGLKWLLVATTTLALLAGNAPLARGADAEPFDIDVILSLSGNLTFVGKAEQETLAVLEPAVNKQGGIGGRPIRFVYHDDKTEPQVAVQLLNGILEKHPAIVLGSSSAVSCLAMAPLTAAAGPVEFCLSPSIAPTRGGYLFSASIAVRDCWAALVRYFRERGLKRIGVLTATDQGGRDGDVSLTAALALPENKDVTIVSHQHFAATDLTVTAQLSLLKAAQPQAVILWAAGTPFATLLRGAAEVGLDLPTGASNGDLTYVQMKQYAAFLPKELVFPGLPFVARMTPSRGARDAQRRFYDLFTAAGIHPDFPYSFAWDPALIAIDALRKLGTAATPEQVRNYIQNLHAFDGISGAYDFRDGSQRGLAQQNLVIVRWQPKQEAWTAVSGLGGSLR
jgi:branched-chain amino acid transport system substrate-binding protein